MLRRRQLMAMRVTEQTYVQDGLVLWMDGINKGDVAGAWVDRITGYEFTGINDPVCLTDSMLFNGSDQYFKNAVDIATIPHTDTGTIEVCDEAESDGIMAFIPRSGDMIAFGYYNSGIIWSTGAGSSRYLANIKAPHNKGTTSICSDLVISNGQNVGFKTNKDYWTGTNGTTYIGCRAGSNRFFKGKIYSIRIYNRRLTQNEILHNQRIDNKRFSLGLSI